MKKFRSFYINGDGSKFACADCKLRVIAYFEDHHMEYVCPDCGVRRAEVEILKKMKHLVDAELEQAGEGSE